MFDKTLKKDDVIYEQPQIRVSQNWKSQKVPPATGFSRSMYIAIYKKVIFFQNFNCLRLPLQASNICSAVCSYKYSASAEVTEAV